MKNALNYLIGLLIIGLISLLAMKTSFATSPNLVSNPSMESSSNNQPTDWVQDNWGSLSASFTYPSSGAQDGSRSLRVDVSNYQNGDAKWFFKPVSVVPGKTYTYETFYKSSATTDIVMQITDSNNMASYSWLKTAPANNTALWQNTKADFTMPSNASKASVFHVVNSNGWLQTDNTFFGLKEDAPTPTDGNLLPNASLETADDRNAYKPSWWSSNSWGQNTPKFTYEVSGQQGNRSVKTEVTSFTSGDAKWFVDPVSVKPNQQYVYSHFYKSNIETQVVVAYIDASGNYTYEWLKSTPVAQDWQELTATFKTPASSQKVSIYHVVDKVGWLQIDNAKLVEYQPQPNTTSVPNPSVETESIANNKLPADWSHNSWGTNKATFEYAKTGRTGKRSVKVTMKNYVDGDAKWYFNPITTLTPGKQYRFSTWFKGTVAPEVVAMFIKADGSEQYFGLPKPLPGKNASTTWQPYTDTFTVPHDAVSTSVFMFINKNGWIQTDDYTITDYQPVGFNRPLLTLTFDDGHEDNVTTALPLLNQYGFKTTQCYTTQHVEGKPQEIQNVLAFFNSGHEICSHTISHPFLTSLTQTQLNNELKHSKQVLESIIGKPVLNFASPYGDYNASVNTAIAKYYQSHRTVDEGYNSKDNFDPMRLRVQNILSSTSASEVQAWIEQAKATNTWLILVYHRVANDPGPFDAYKSTFAQQLEVISQSGITVKTYQDALTEVRAQI